MQYIVVGFFLILINIFWPVKSAETEALYYIDLLPDVIGFLLIWFTLEKKAKINKLFKITLTCSAALAAVQFVYLICQIRFLVIPLVEKFPETLFLGAAITFISSIFDACFGIINALTWAFAALFLSALIKKMQDDGRKITEIVLQILRVCCGLIAAAYIASEWIEIPIYMESVTIPVAVVMLITLFSGLRRTEEFK